MVGVGGKRSEHLATALILNCLHSDRCRNLGEGLFLLKVAENASDVNDILLMSPESPKDDLRRQLKCHWWPV